MQLFFIDFSEKRNGFLMFLRFLHFRTRILTKNATFLSILVKNVMVFLMFLSFLYFRTRILITSYTLLTILMKNVMVFGRVGIVRSK